MTREEAIKMLNTLLFLGTVDCTKEEANECVKMAIKALEQEPKIGHWKAFIHNAYHGTDEDGEPIWREVTVYHCSQCNRRTVIKEKYCPNCGVKMENK